MSRAFIHKQATYLVTYTFRATKLVVWIYKQDVLWFQIRVSQTVVMQNCESRQQNFSWTNNTQISKAKQKNHVQYAKLKSNNTTFSLFKCLFFIRLASKAMKTQVT